MQNKKLSPLVWFYAVCSAADAIVPWYFNLQAIKSYNTVMILSQYFKEGTATPLTFSITTDFFIGTTPVLVWMCVEAKRMGLKHWWLILPATFLVSFAFSCPLFLALRERKSRHKIFK